MSILFTSENGWIISHIDYLNNIYQTIENDNKLKTLKFNETFFKVNSRYLRQNQIESCKNRDDNEINKKKKKRKNLQKQPDEILEQNDFVKKMSSKILDEASHLKLFSNTISDNNEASRLEANNFFSDRLQTNCNYHGTNNKEVAIIAEHQKEKYVFPKKSSFYCYDVNEINEKIQTTEKFDFILLDPPWWNKSIRRKKAKFVESSYKMMYNEELVKIPIKNILNTNGIVAVWCTNCSSHIKSILEELFPAWGIIFKTKWYWLKVTQSGETICDFNEIHGKQPYEQIIFGTTCLNTNFNLPDEKLIISIPSSVHSHKPPLTEILKPYLPKNNKCLEMFARYLLPNWTSWGLEVLKFQHLSLYTEMDYETACEDSKSAKS